MRYALFIVLGVEAIWYSWAYAINGLYEADTISNGWYFISMFVCAAVLDYVAVQALLTGKYSKLISDYITVLIALFATSILLHMVGMVGYFIDSATILTTYDTCGVLILIMEAGVFVAYGANLVRARHNHRHLSSVKGHK